MWAQEAMEGFKLTGWMKPSGVFLPRLKPPLMLVSDLVQGANFFVEHVLHRIKPSGNGKLDEELWEATLAEVREGFLEGPYSVARLPAGCVLSPRFGVTQNGKVSPVDDFSASSVNHTIGLEEKLQVEAIDEVLSILKCSMQLHGRRSQLLRRRTGNLVWLRLTSDSLGLCFGVQSIRRQRSSG